MKTWVRRSLNVGALTAGALLATGAAAQANPMVSDDHHGALNGTQVKLPVQAPINVCGNAVAVLSDLTGTGEVDAHCQGGATALLPEWTYSQSNSMVSSGHRGILNGTQVQAPIQVPVNVCGNAIAVLGDATAQCDGGAQAGPEQPDDNGNGPGNGGGNPGNGGYGEPPALDPDPYAGVPNLVQNVASDLVADVVPAALPVAPLESGALGGGSTLLGSGNKGLLNGVQIYAPVQIPIDICGNAISVLGSALGACDGGATARH